MAGTRMVLRDAPGMTVPPMSLIIGGTVTGLILLRGAARLSVRGGVAFGLAAFVVAGLIVDDGGVFAVEVVLVQLVVDV